MPETRDYTYKTLSGPDALAVSLATVKSHLKITSSFQDDLLTLYIKSAIEYAENITRRDLITRTYKTFRDFFPAPSQNEGHYSFGQIPSFNSGTSSISANVGFEIRKSPIQSVEKIEYFVQGVLQVLDNTIYYNTVESDYSEILTNQGKDWPTNADQRLQTIEITFKNGFGDADTDIPQVFTVAILQHVSALYANRGDCGGAQGSAIVPAAAKSFYLQSRIENL